MDPAHTQALALPRVREKTVKHIAMIAAMMALMPTIALAIDLNAHLRPRYDANAQYACNLYQRAARAHVEGLLSDEAYRQEYQRVLRYAVYSNVPAVREIVAAHQAHPEAYAQHATTLWNYCARVPTAFQ
jgi:hypothetical protein